MDVEAISNVNAGYSANEVVRQTPQPQPVSEIPIEATEVPTATTTAVTRKSEAGTGQDEQGQEKEDRRKEASESSIDDAVRQANRSLEQTRCEYSYHKETKRVSIKVIDKNTDKVIREIPPEKSLDMLQKMWEMAGILVDEKR